MRIIENVFFWPMRFAVFLVHEKWEEGTMAYENVSGS